MLTLTEEVNRMKKDLEYDHLLRFRDACPAFPNGRIEATERPDFVIHTQEKLVGIEHTQVFQPGTPHGGSLQAQESLAQWVVDQARDLHIRAGGSPLSVRILFNPGVEIKKQDVAIIAEAVAVLVGKAGVDSGGCVELKPTGENYDSFPRQVGIIRIRLRPHGQQHQWSRWSSGFIAALAPKDIQETIGGKERKLDSYSTKCSEVWLLIVANECGISSTVELTRSAVEHCYQTQFDRVFFFWNWDSSFVELKVGDEVTHTNESI